MLSSCGRVQTEPAERALLGVLAQVHPEQIEIDDVEVLPATPRQRQPLQPLVLTTTTRRIKYLIGSDETCCKFSLDGHLLRADLQRATTAVRRKILMNLEPTKL